VPDVVRVLCGDSSGRTHGLGRGWGCQPLAAHAADGARA
jgi:hypothetical protein